MYMSLLIIKQAIIDLLSPLGIEWITRQAIVQSLDLGEIPVTWDMSDSGTIIQYMSNFHRSCSKSNCKQQFTIQIELIKENLALIQPGCFILKTCKKKEKRNNPISICIFTSSINKHLNLLFMVCKLLSYKICSFNHYNDRTPRVKLIAVRQCSVLPARCEIDSSKLIEPVLNFLHLACV